MKRSVALLLPLLSACGPRAAPPDALVECAVDGAAAFARVCTVARSPGPETVFTIRSPSGSFRRLVATGDGRGVMAADGAEAATVTVIRKDLVEVAIGTDRYRLPATVR
ncbi:MAG: hypothetical protein QOJ27_1361 [Sphingomonadales bacterium]|nr:hypothetical protein [Sphingomonadales bacterium]